MNLFLGIVSLGLYGFAVISPSWIESFCWCFGAAGIMGYLARKADKFDEQRKERT